MPMVIQPLGKESVDSEISCVSSNIDGTYIAWATYKGLLSIKNIQINEIKEIQLESYATQIGMTSKNNFIIGQEEGNLINFSKNCDKLWELKCPAGCELLKCSEMGDLIVIIDGTNTLRTISSKGEVLGIFSEFELIGMSVNKKGSAISCWDDEGNLFVLNRNCKVIFKREKNEKFGERIITTKFTSNGILLVSKESLEIPESGDQNELEFWNPLGQKIGCVSFNSKCLTLNSNGNIIFAGLFNGEVYSIHNNNLKLIWKSDYAIKKVIPINNDILISSWFYLYRINSENGNEIWRVEHEGIIDHLITTLNKNIVVLAGNDRNDYTNAAPLIFIDPHAEPYWEEEKEDLIEIEENVTLIQESKIYETSDDDLKEILGDDFEKYKSTKSNKKDTSMSDLMAAFDEDIPTVDKNVDDSDSLSLIEHLLSKDEKRNQPPICNAGDDQNLESGEDGNCIVLLDGSSSHDPDGFIRLWNWTSEDGRSLSNEPKIKLRLPKGIHRFTLTVTDDEGAMSTDSIIVKII